MYDSPSKHGTINFFSISLKEYSLLLLLFWLLCECLALFVFLICYTCMCTTVNVNILSLKVRGIREQTKRRSIFSYLKDQKANIDFLQATYSEPAHGIYGKMNGVASYFPMALIIVKVYAFQSCELSN